MPSSNSQSPYSTDQHFGQQLEMWDYGQIVSFYERFAKKYDLEPDLNKLEYPGPLTIAEWSLAYLYRSLLPLDSNSITLRILDLGCGTGQSSVPFLEHMTASESKFKFDIFGIDATPAVFPELI